MKKTGNASGGGKNPSGRDLTVRVKTAKKRTTSSKLWLERQLNDPWVIAAQKNGYRSRATFKLLQLDQKYHLLRAGMRVVDLGAAPGGWTDIAVRKVKPETGRGAVVGIDLLEITPIPGATLIQGDFLAPDAPDKLIEALGGKADLVMSDMAANTTGHSRTDHLRVIALAEAAAEFALDILAPNGAFVAKVFQGGSEGSLLTLLKKSFATVRHAKPAASRADSAEIYVVATGFRGTESPAAKTDPSELTEK